MSTPSSQRILKVSRTVRARVRALEVVLQQQSRHDASVNAVLSQVVDSCKELEEVASEDVSPPSSVSAPPEDVAASVHKCVDLLQRQLDRQQRDLDEARVALRQAQAAVEGPQTAAGGPQAAAEGPHAAAGNPQESQSTAQTSHGRGAIQSRDSTFDHEDTTEHPLPPGADGDIRFRTGDDDDPFADVPIPHQKDIDALLLRHNLEPASPTIQNANQLHRRKRTGKAVEVLTGLLKLMRHLAPEHSAIVYIHMAIARMHHDVSVYNKSIAAWREALQLSPNNAAVLVGLGAALHGSEQYREAVGHLRHAVDLMAKTPTEHSTTEIAEGRIQLGASMFMSGDRDQGVTMVQDGIKIDCETQLGLMWMTEFMIFRRMWPEAAQWGTQLLLRWQQKKLARQQVARIFGLIPNALDVLRTVHAAQWSTFDSILGCMGVCVRDHGHLRLSQQLLEETMAIDPWNPTVALNYVNVLESRGLGIDALKFVKRYLREQVGTMALRHIPLLTVEDLIGDVTGLQNRYPCTLETARERLTLPRAAVRLQDKEVVTCDLQAAAGMPLRTIPRADGEASVQYTQVELDVMAMVFTVIKICFLYGLLDRIPPLAALMSPLCVGAQLHLTHVTNEAAFFTLQAALMQYLDPNDDVGRVERCIYAVGDSHSLPPSWHTLCIQGKPTLVISALVTGCKIWHLREESVFYPKRAYEAIVSNIPKGSDVLLTLGEIDCREGITSAVDQGRYESVDEAIRAVVQVYIARVEDLRRKARRVFVHLPPPVLDPTRSLVLRFHRAVLEMMQPLTQGKGSSVFILQVPVLTEDGSRIRSDCQLDGTHLSPAYLKYLEIEINRVLGG